MWLEKSDWLMRSQQFPDHEVQYTTMSEMFQLYISVKSDHNLEALAWVHLHQDERRGNEQERW